MEFYKILGIKEILLINMSYKNTRDARPVVSLLPQV